jgi:hypothetical protein
MVAAACDVRRRPSGARPFKRQRAPTPFTHSPIRREVVVRIPDTPDGPGMPAAARRSVYRMDAAPARAHRGPGPCATTSASHQPTIRREKTSMTNAAYTNLSRVGRPMPCCWIAASSCSTQLPTSDSQRHSTSPRRESSAAAPAGVAGTLGVTRDREERVAAPEPLSSIYDLSGFDSGEAMLDEAAAPVAGHEASGGSRTYVVSGAGRVSVLRLRHMSGGARGSSRPCTAQHAGSDPGDDLGPVRG